MEKRMNSNKNIKNYFSSGATIFFFSLLILFFLIHSCNPVHEPEDDSEQVSTAIHTKKIGGYLHGFKFRFPTGNCDESTCHNSGLIGGSSTALSCYSCHDDVWVFFETHNKNKEGKYHHKDICESGTFNTLCGTSDCHGDDLNGGTEADSGPSCISISCHNKVPDDGDCD